MRILWIAIAGGMSFAAVADSVKVESLQGPARLRQKSAETALRQGQTLQSQDVIVTGKNGVVSLVYADGTRAMVGQSSRYVILPDAQNSTWSELSQGHARIWVKKAEAAGKAPKFSLRTHAVVLGVRGTDFTVDASEKGATQVHTLEGKVDVAKDAATLWAGKGVSLVQNQSLSAELGKLNSVQKFDRAVFLRDLQVRQPQMQNLIQKLPMPALPPVGNPGTPPIPKPMVAPADARVAMPPIVLPPAPGAPAPPGVPGNAAGRGVIPAPPPGVPGSFAGPNGPPPGFPPPKPPHAGQN